jgi:hypothetical protein
VYLTTLHITYRRTRDTAAALTVIIAYTATEHGRVTAQLTGLDLEAHEDINVIDARSDIKPTGSKA